MDRLDCIESVQTISRPLQVHEVISVTVAELLAKPFSVYLTFELVTFLPALT